MTYSRLNGLPLLRLYCQWILEQYREVDLPFPPNSRYRPRILLHSVYLELQGSFAKSPAFATETLAKKIQLCQISLEPEQQGFEEQKEVYWKSASENRRDRILSIRRALEDCPRLLLVAEPGGGKTTTLRWLAIEAAMALLAEEDPNAVPILVDLRRFAEERRRRPELRLAGYLGRHLASAEAQQVATAAGESIELEALNHLLLQELRDDGAILLIDGFDGIGDPTERTALIREIDDFLSALSTANPSDSSGIGRGTRVVIALGHDGTGPDRFLTPFDQLTLEKLSPADAEELCRRFSPALTRGWQPETTDALIRRVALLRQRGTAEFVSSPLFLTLILLNPLPEAETAPSRTELCRKLAGILLKRWQIQSSQAGLSRPQLEALICSLAASFQQHTLSAAMDTAALDQFLSDWLSEPKGSGDLPLTLESSGFLIAAEGGTTFRFLHPAIQEYLAARWLTADPDPPSRLGEFLGDPDWLTSTQMALCLICSDQRGEQLESSLRDFFALDGEVPHASLALAAALRDHPDCPAASIEAAAERLLDFCARVRSPSPKNLTAQAFRELLKGPCGPVAKAVLVGALDDDRRNPDHHTAAAYLLDRMDLNSPPPVEQGDRLKAKVPQLLRAALAAEPADRCQAMARFWAEMLLEDAPELETKLDRTYLLGLILDTYGDFLSNPPLLLAESLADPTASREDARALLSSTLDRLERVPGDLDFFRGWVLVRLSPLVAKTQLDGEALLIASTLSDRLGARRDTLLRLLPPEDCRRSWIDEAPTRKDLLIELHRDRPDELARVSLERRISISRPERFEVSADTVCQLVAQLEGEDDLARYRAALALHGDGFTASLAHRSSRMGEEAIRGLAREWLKHKNAKPKLALALRWAFECLEHDDRDLIESCLELTKREGPGREEACVVLANINHLRADLGKVFRAGLRDAPLAAREALLESLCTLLARRRLPPGLCEDLNSLDLEGSNKTISSSTPDSLVAALERAGSKNESETAGERSSWHEILQLPPDQRRQTLTAIGERRLIGPDYEAAVERAARRVAGNPDLFGKLLEALNCRLKRQSQDVERDAHGIRDLLAVTAATAMRLPRAFLDQALELADLETSLGKAAERSDSFVARRAAIELLGLLRRVTAVTLEALQSGLLDVAEVQASAIRSLSWYRELDPTMLVALERDLVARSPARAYATGRLLAVLARNVLLDRKLRVKLSAMLSGVIPHIASEREVFLMKDAPVGNFERRRSIEKVGQLQDLFYQFLMSATGWRDLFAE